MDIIGVLRNTLGDIMEVLCGQESLVTLEIFQYFEGYFEGKFKCTLVLFCGYLV